MTGYKNCFSAHKYQLLHDSNGINKMTDLFKKVIWYYDYVLFYIVKYTPVVGWVVQEKFNKEVRRKPRFLASVADIFKNQDMCDNAVRRKP